MEANKHNRIEYVFQNKDFTLFILVIIVKLFIFNYLIKEQFSDVKLILYALPLIFMISWLIMLCNRTVRFYLWVIVLIILSTVLLADVFYYKYYGSFVNFSVLSQASQLIGVKSSVTSLFEIKDLLLYIDVIIFVYIYFNFFQKKDSTFKQRIIPSIIVLGVGLASTFFLGYRSMALLDIKEIKDLRANEIILAELGILPYLVIDFATSTQPIQRNSAYSDEIREWLRKRKDLNPNEYTAVGKGKNVIIVQLEAMQQFVIGSKVNGQEITPNLNKLAQESLYFSNYFSQISQGTTADAEFISLNSLYPLKNGAVYSLYNENTFFSLPNVLKDYGYNTYVMHAFNPDYWSRNEIYPQFEIDHFFSNQDFKIDEIVGLGLSDRSMFLQSVELLKTLNSPYFSMIIGLSGHHPYKIPGSLRGLDIPENQFSPLFTDYLQSQHYVDQAFGAFMERIKEEGILDNAILVVYGDHFGTGWTTNDITEFLNVTAYSPLVSSELYKLPLFIRIPNGIKPKEITVTGGQIDLYPTLANLLGIDEQKMVHLGNDLLSEKRGYVAFRRYIPSGSFATNELFYIANPKEGFSKGNCYNRLTQEEVNLNKCRNGYDIANEHFEMSDYILKTDLIPLLLNNE